MIDLNAETVVSLADAARQLPARRSGKKPHVSCIYRWTQAGCRGVRLESIQVGGTRCTSVEALSRFFQRLSSIPVDDGPSVDQPLRLERHSKRVDSAERELDQLGIGRADTVLTQREGSR